MIELKRARALLTALRLAANNFKNARAWGDHSRFEVDEWHESVAGYPDLAAEYGLPPDTDLNVHPEEVFPPPKAKPGAVPVARSSVTGVAPSVAIPCRASSTPASSGPKTSS